MPIKGHFGKPGEFMTAQFPATIAYFVGGPEAGKGLLAKDFPNDTFTPAYYVVGRPKLTKLETGEIVESPTDSEQKAYILEPIRTMSGSVFIYRYEDLTMYQCLAKLLQIYCKAVRW